jgi:GTP-binding protein
MPQLANTRRPHAGLFHHAKFWTTIARWDQMTPPTAPEIAFVGRSNAGKSSVINALANEGRLAFVSKQPGRTRQINFFNLRNGAILADLPGYGYAEASYTIKDTWEALLARYLSTRESLVGLVMIMDVRHPLTELDRRMLAWFAPTGKNVHVLLNKADKLSPMAARKVLSQVKDELAGHCTVQLFSSLRKQGVPEVEDCVGAWLAPWAKEKPLAEGETNQGQNALN